MRNIFCIVEGDGEVEAVPVLVKRIGQERKDAFPIVKPPALIKPASFLKFDAYFKKHVELQANKAADRGGIVLIMLDCENDCPATLGPKIKEEAQKVRGDVEYVVSLASREYETWFMFAAQSIAGESGLSSDLEPPANPEAKRDAKGWLSEQMPSGSSYNPTTHQKSLTTVFSLDQAAKSHSFARLVERLLPHL